MATIAHLSDVHFGKHDPAIVEALERFLIARRPDLVVISGDFTQRARVEQYRQACRWIERLEAEGLSILAVPGNHDVPLYDIVRRFVRPLHRYRRFIDDDLCPWHENDELAVLGINTARSLTIKDGRINRDQMEIIRTRFAGVSPRKTRILVTHHPLFAMPLGEEGALTKVVGRHEPALEAVAEAGVHVLLAGHYHRTFSKSARDVVETAGPELVIQAGTATSVRLRGDELQSFNWIETEGPTGLRLEIFAWSEAGFTPGAPEHFRLDGGSWRSGTAAAAAARDPGS